VRRRLLAWLEVHGRSFAWRRRSASLYRLVVTEALLQRTRAETVNNFYAAFFRRFPSWQALAQASEAELQEHLRPIGLWKRRATSLRRLGIEMAKRKGRFPSAREKIEALPGVGQYVASAVLLFAHGRSEPLLDASVARVLERHFGPRRLADIRYDPYLQTLARTVVSSKHPAKVNWALLDLAALICRIRSPLCQECPLSATCHDYARRRNNVHHATEACAVAEPLASIRAV
jgi:A/G-specific adenine glycosylase